MVYGRIDPPMGHYPPSGGGPRYSWDGRWMGLPVANGWWRLLAVAVDVVLAQIVSSFVMALFTTSTSRDLFWLLLVANNVVLQGITGQSLGKMILGLHLIKPFEPTADSRLRLRQPVGLLLAVARGVIHILDGLAFPISIPYLLSSQHRQTIADHWTGTICLRTRELRQVPLAQPLSV